MGYVTSISTPSFTSLINSCYTSFRMAKRIRLGGNTCSWLSCLKWRVTDPGSFPVWVESNIAGNFCVMSTTLGGGGNVKWVCVHSNEFHRPHCWQIEQVAVLVIDYYKIDIISALRDRIFNLCHLSSIPCNQLTINRYYKVIAHLSLTYGFPFSSTI